MIEQDPNDLLWDVPVDQTTGERVTPLVWGQMNGRALSVVDLTEGQPRVEHPSVAVVAQRTLSTGVALELGNEVRVLPGPPVRGPLLLCTNLDLEVGIDGDGGRTAHLVVDVAQVGAALVIVEQTVKSDVPRVCWRPGPTRNVSTPVDTA